MAIAGVLALGLTAGPAAPVAAATLHDVLTDASKASLQQPSSYQDGKYIVTLKNEAAAAYRGGTGAFERTRPDSGSGLDVRSQRVMNYSSFLRQQQQDVAGSVDATITTSYSLATNGFSAQLSGQQATAIAADPRVSAVLPDQLLQPQGTSSTDFLGLSGDEGVWAHTGGQDKAGEGVVVGVIDSGIAPENPSFAGNALTSAAGPAPYLDGDDIVYDKADGSTFRGRCETGEAFDATDCSTKLIGARYFVDAYGPDTIGIERGEHLSPRDGSGHGSHTTSTAAGNANVSAEVGGRQLGTISGVVPAAKIAMYKVCWTGPTPGDDGCQTGDLLAGIDAAVADNVDVINYSIGGGAAQTTISLTDAAFLNAAAAGIFVAAAAGNDGPDPSTADNAAPWITTVAASTIPSYYATATLGDGKSFLGGSITIPQDAPIRGPFVNASAVSVPEAEDPQLCGPDTLDPAKVQGAVVLCDRGVVDRVAKSAEVARAGGIGMVLVNSQPDSMDLDTHSIPTLHIDASAADELHAYANLPHAVITLTDGNPHSLATPPTPQIAGFSSRGPVTADGGNILKPDIAAPGVGILAAFSNEDGQKGRFALESGTSMASPHIAGLAALYLAEHPAASPSEIKSAMMTTAYDTVDAAGSPVSDPFAQGAGQVDPTKYFDPGMLFLNDVDDWYGYAQAVTGLDLGYDTVAPSDLNIPSVSVGHLAGTQTITRTATATRAGTFTAENPNIHGVDVVIAPSTLTFSAAGQQQSYSITFTRTNAPLDVFATGQLIWKNGDQSVTTPLAVRPTTLSVPSELSAQGTTSSTQIPVQVGTTTDVEIAKAGLAKGQTVRGTGRAPAGNGPVQHDQHIIDVPAGITFARFALDSVDNSADLDLHLYRYDEFEQIIEQDKAETANADETLDIPALSEGRFIVDVGFLAGNGDLDYSLTSYLLGPDSNDGNLTVSPAPLHLAQGEPAALTAAWSGLQPGASYLGRIGFGQTGLTTNITITTPGTPPATNGDLSIQIDRAWARAGTTIAVHATGIAVGQPYTMRVDGTSTSVGGVGSLEGAADRPLPLPTSLADGPHTVSISAGQDSTETTLNIANVVLFDAFPTIDYNSDGAASTLIETSYAGTGKLRVSITGAGGTALDEQIPVAMDPIFFNDSVRSSSAMTPAGIYNLDVWNINEDDSVGQHLSHTFTVEAQQPSDVTISQNPANPDLADLTYTNRAGTYPDMRLRYKLCTGPVVFALFPIDSELVTRTIDMTAATYVELIRPDGKILASYENAGPARCASAPNITQDFWMTFTNDPTRVSTQTPITMTWSNRYPAWSTSFDFTAGFGDSIYKDIFHSEKVATPLVLEPGPVSTITLQVPDNKPVWTRAYYEINSPDIVKIQHRVIYALPVSLDMLNPVTDKPAPGDPESPAPALPGFPGDTVPGESPTSSPTPEAEDGEDLAATGLEVLGTSLAAFALLAAGITISVRRARRRA